MPINGCWLECAAEDVSTAWLEPAYQGAFNCLLKPLDLGRRRVATEKLAERARL